MMADRSSRWTLWLLVVLLLVTFALRVYRLEAQSLWSDEGLSLYRARLTLGENLSNVIVVPPKVVTQDTNPPLYFVVLSVLRAAAGESEYVLRFVSVIAGVLLVPLLYDKAETQFVSATGKIESGDVKGGLREAVKSSPLFDVAEIEAILNTRAKTLMPAPAASADTLATDVTPPSCFLAALARSDPAALADRTILGNLIYIMQITWGDVTGLLLWVFKMLSDHPEWRERLAREPSRDLATRIVLETLRLEQSESRYRRAVADLELDGFRIPKGWLVRMCIRESHRDEKVFPDPLVFDPERFCGRAFTRGEYAPFGAFRLACIGEDVTKAVAGSFALELACGFDWEVVEDGPARISSWVHNAPHPRLSVTMKPRARAA